MVYCPPIRGAVKGEQAKAHLWKLRALMTVGRAFEGEQSEDDERDVSSRTPSGRIAGIF